MAYYAEAEITETRGIQDVHKSFNVQVGDMRTFKLDEDYQVHIGAEFEYDLHVILPGYAGITATVKARVTRVWGEDAPIGGDNETP